MRATMPDAPIGTTFDTVSYFPSVLILSVCVIVMFIKYNKQIHRETKENIASQAPTSDTDSLYSSSSTSSAYKVYPPHHDGDHLNIARQRIKSKI